MTAFRSQLLQQSRSICELTERQIQRLESHFDLMSRWNRRLNLTSISDLSTVVRRHYCESLELAVALPAGRASVVDLGTGPGFPGFPIAVVRNDLDVVLIESNSKKCVFLREVSRGLENVSVIEGRGEDLEGCFDWVVSRAVAWKSVLRVASGVGKNVALMLSGADTSAALAESDFKWHSPKCLRSGDNLMLLLGEVPRGTQLRCST